MSENYSEASTATGSRVNVLKPCTNQSFTYPCVSFSLTKVMRWTFPSSVRTVVIFTFLYYELLPQNDITHRPVASHSSAAMLKSMHVHGKGNRASSWHSFLTVRTVRCVHSSHMHCTVQRVTECEINVDIHGSNLPRPSPSGTLRAECHFSDRE